VSTSEKPPAQAPPAQAPPAQAPPAQAPPAQAPPAQAPPAQTPPAQTPPAQTPTPGELERRAGIAKDIGDWKRTFFKIPVRHLTTQEWTEELLRAEIKSDYLMGKPVSFGSPRAEPLPVKPAASKDPLDKVRVAATLLMVGALFAIVAVIVFKRSPPSGVYQIVSLASGLAGIGLGWLFGAAAVRSKK
jgi:hypothetical protein